jgi:putative membrane protein
MENFLITQILPAPCDSFIVSCPHLKQVYAFFMQFFKHLWLKKLMNTAYVYLLDHAAIACVARYDSAVTVQSPRTVHTVMKKHFLFWIFAAVVIALVASGINPKDQLTWFLEVAPVLIALPLLWFTRRSFPLTTLLYCLIALHCLILILGGHYTYAEVPLGFWMQDAFGFARNHYDRIGHFAQGFVPAMIAREILLRNTALRTGLMTAFLCICVAMFISAGYELIEMAVALASGEAADAFLGTQGDPWDTQKDMLMALIGATVAQVMLSGLHDQQLRGTSHH